MGGSLVRCWLILVYFLVNRSGFKNSEISEANLVFYRNICEEYSEKYSDRRIDRWEKES